MFMNIKKITKTLFILLNIMFLQMQLTHATETLKRRAQNFRQVTDTNITINQNTNKNTNENKNSLKQLSMEIRELIQKIKINNKETIQNINLIKAKTAELKTVVLQPSFLEALQKLIYELTDPKLQETLLLQCIGKYLRTSDLITTRKMIKNNIGKKLNYFTVELIFKLVNSLIEWFTNCLGQKIILSIQDNTLNNPKTFEIDIFDNSHVTIKEIKEKLNAIEIKLDMLKTKWNEIKPFIPPVDQRQKLTKTDIERFWNIILPVKILVIEPTIKTVSDYLFGDITSLIPFWAKIKYPILMTKIEQLMAEVSIELFQQIFSKTDIQLMQNLFVKQSRKTDDDAPIGYKLLHCTDKHTGEKIWYHVKMNLIKFLQSYYSKVVSRLF